MLKLFNSSKHRQCFRAISLLVITTFVFPLVSWAFETPLYTHPPGKILWNNQSIAIPQKFGTAIETFQASNQLVIYIQDLHCNYEVQSNIAQIIQHCAQEYGLKMVAVEGASQAINVSKLATFPLAEVKQATTDFLLKQGKISGPEMIAAIGEKPIQLQGIETAELYNANLNSVLKFLNDENQGYIFDLNEMLNELKQQVYNPRLMALDQKKQAYRNQSLSLLKYSLALQNYATTQKIVVDNFPNFKLYLTQSSEAFPPALDSDRFFQEIETLDQTVRNSLYTQPDQATLDDLQRHLDIMERLINISATPEDLARLRQTPQLFKIARFAEFLAAHNQQQELTLETESYALDNVLDEIRNFYQLADDRSQAFVANTLRNMQAQQTSIAVLITGGFHTEAILAALKNRNISYLCVKPNLTHLDVLNPYFNILRNRKSPLEKLLAQNQTILAPRLASPESAIPTQQLLSEAQLTNDQKLFYRQVDLLHATGSIRYWLKHAQQRTEASLRTFFQTTVQTCPGLSHGKQLSEIRGDFKNWLMVHFSDLGLWSSIQEQAGNSIQRTSATASWTTKEFSIDFLDNTTAPLVAKLLSQQTSSSWLISLFQLVAAQIITLVKGLQQTLNGFSSTAASLLPRFLSTPPAKLQLPAALQSHTASKDINSALPLESFAEVSARPLSTPQTDLQEFTQALVNHTTRIHEILHHSIQDTRILNNVMQMLNQVGAGSLALQLQSTDEIIGGIAVSQATNTLLRIILEKQVQGVLKNSTVLHEIVESILVSQRVPRAHALAFMLEQALYPESLLAKLADLAHYDDTHLENLITNETTDFRNAILQQTTVTDFVKQAQLKNALAVSQAAAKTLNARYAKLGLERLALSENTQRRHSLGMILLNQPSLIRAQLNSRALAIQAARALTQALATKSDQDLATLFGKISGQTIAPADFTGKITVSYFNQGAHKYVYKLDLELKTSRHKTTTLPLVLKMAIEQDDITSDELNDLKALTNNELTPNFGLEFKDGNRRYLLEEFIAGPTAREAAAQNPLSTQARSAIIKNLLNISLLLGGQIPKDMHGNNFVFSSKQTDNQAIMIDIGNQRISPEQALLRLIAFYGYFGETAQLGNNRFIFQNFVDSYGFSGKDNGLVLLKKNLEHIARSQQQESLKMMPAAAPNLAKQRLREARGEPALLTEDITKVLAECNEFIQEQNKLHPDSLYQRLAFPNVFLVTLLATGLSILVTALPILPILANGFLLWSLAKTGWVLSQLQRNYGWRFLAHLNQPVGLYNPLLGTMVKVNDRQQIAVTAPLLVRMHDQFAHRWAQRLADRMLQPFGKSLAQYAQTSKKGPGYLFWNGLVSEVLAHGLDAWAIPFALLDSLFPKRILYRLMHDFEGAASSEQRLALIAALNAKISELKSTRTGKSLNTDERISAFLRNQLENLATSNRRDESTRFKNAYLYSSLFQLFQETQGQQALDQFALERLAAGDPLVWNTWQPLAANHLSQTSATLLQAAFSTTADPAAITQLLASLEIRLNPRLVYAVINFHASRFEVLQTLMQTTALETGYRLYALLQFGKQIESTNLASWLKTVDGPDHAIRNYIQQLQQDQNRANRISLAGDSAIRDFELRVYTMAVWADTALAYPELSEANYQGYLRKINRARINSAITGADSYFQFNPAYLTLIPQNPAGFLLISLSHELMHNLLYTDCQYNASLEFEEPMMIHEWISDLLARDFAQRNGVVFSDFSLIMEFENAFKNNRDSEGVAEAEYEHDAARIQAMIIEKVFAEAARSVDYNKLLRTAINYLKVESNRLIGSIPLQARIFAEYLGPQAVASLPSARLTSPLKSPFSERGGYQFALMTPKEVKNLLTASLAKTQLQPLHLPGALLTLGISGLIASLGFAFPLVALLAGGLFLGNLVKTGWLLGNLFQNHGLAFLAHITEPIGAYNPELGQMVNPKNTDELLATAPFWVRAHDQYAHRWAQILSDAILGRFDHSLSDYAEAARKGNKTFGYYFWNMAVCEILAHGWDTIAAPLAWADNWSLATPWVATFFRSLGLLAGVLLSLGIPVTLVALGALTIGWAIPAVILLGLLTAPLFYELLRSHDYRIVAQSVSPVYTEQEAAFKHAVLVHRVDLSQLPVGTLVHYRIDGGKWDYTVRIEPNQQASIWLRNDHGQVQTAISNIIEVNAIKPQTSHGVLDETFSVAMPYFNQTPWGADGKRQLMKIIPGDKYTEIPQNIRVLLPTDQATAYASRLATYTSKELAAINQKKYESLVRIDTYILWSSILRDGKAANTSQLKLKIATNAGNLGQSPAIINSVLNTDWSLVSQDGFDLLLAKLISKQLFAPDGKIIQAANQDLIPTTRIPFQPLFRALPSEKKNPSTSGIQQAPDRGPMALPAPAQPAFNEPLLQKQPWLLRLFPRAFLLLSALRLGLFQNTAAETITPQAANSITDLNNLKITAIPQEFADIFHLGPMAFDVLPNNSNSPFGDFADNIALENSLPSTQTTDANTPLGLVIYLPARLYTRLLRGQTSLPGTLARQDYARALELASNIVKFQASRFHQASLLNQHQYAELAPTAAEKNLPAIGETISEHEFISKQSGVLHVTQSEILRLFTACQQEFQAVRATSEQSASQNQFRNELRSWLIKQPNLDTALNRLETLSDVSDPTLKSLQQLLKHTHSSTDAKWNKLFTQGVLANLLTLLTPGDNASQLMLQSMAISRPQTSISNVKILGLPTPEAAALLAQVQQMLAELNTAKLKAPGTRQRLAALQTALEASQGNSFTQFTALRNPAHGQILAAALAAMAQDQPIRMGEDFITNVYGYSPGVQSVEVAAGITLAQPAILEIRSTSTQTEEVKQQVRSSQQNERFQILPFQQRQKTPASSIDHSWFRGLASLLQRFHPVLPAFLSLRLQAWAADLNPNWTFQQAAQKTGNLLADTRLYQELAQININSQDPVALAYRAMLQEKSAQARAEFAKVLLRIIRAGQSQDELANAKEWLAFSEFINQLGFIPTLTIARADLSKTSIWKKLPFALKTRPFVLPLALLEAKRSRGALGFVVERLKRSFEVDNAIIRLFLRKGLMRFGAAA